MLAAIFHRRIRAHSWRAITRFCLLPGALALLLGTGALAEPDVTIRPASLGLPLSAGDTFSDWLYLSAAQPGSLTIDSIDVVYVRGPDETGLSTTAVTREFTPGTSGTTIRFRVTLVRKEFSYPGNYKIGFFVRGKRNVANSAEQTPIDEVIEVSLHRAAAQITVKIGNDARVTVQRGDEQQISFWIIQDRRADISDLKLVQGTVGGTTDNALAPGKIELVPPALSITNGAATGTLRFSGFSAAGDFKSELSFTSSSLEKPVTVPVMIRVKDGWFWPLLTIIAGVIGGTAVHVLVHIWRPRQLLAYRLVQLRGRLQALQNAIAEPATRQEYDRLLGRLVSLTQGLDLDLTNDAAVEQMQTEIATFEAKIAKVQADVDQALKTLARHLWQTRRDLKPFIPTVEQDLKEVEKLVENCRSRYEEGHSEEAAAAIESASAVLKDTRTRLAETTIAAMRQEINALPDATIKARLTADAEQARTELRRPDANVGEILTGLRAKIDDAKGPVADAQMAADAEAVVVQPPAQPTITVDLAPEDRRAGVALKFKIVGARADISKVKWAFDGLGRDSKDLLLEYRFDVPGQYLVTAVVEYPSGSPDTALPLRINVLPSETQLRADKIKQSIRDVDFALLAVSLILAALSGLLDRYADKPFGTVTDYCWAFLWGFGIDNVVRGFGATFGRIKG